MTPAACGQTLSVPAPWVGEVRGGGRRAGVPGGAGGGGAGRREGEGGAGGAAGAAQPAGRARPGPGPLRCWTWACTASSPCAPSRSPPSLPTFTRSTPCHLCHDRSVSEYVSVLDRCRWRF